MAQTNNRKSNGPNMRGVKLLILAASFTATLGGWAALTLNQVTQIAENVTPANRTTTVQRTGNLPAGLRVVTAPVRQPSAITFTRSSR